MPKMPETQAVCPSSGVAPARAPPKLRQLGYLETGIDAAVATGYDPLRDDEPELARTMAASVKQRIAFGERAGQTFDGLARDLVMQGNVPNSRVLAAPVSTAFRCTPTPRCQPIGVTSWSA